MGIERIAPLFHLINGDLCYANQATDRVRTWADWFANNGRSARHRPWMPAAGNYENERGNGPIGYSAYQANSALPRSGAEPALAGLWYTFTAGRCASSASTTTTSASKTAATPTPTATPAEPNAPGWTPNSEPPAPTPLPTG